MREFPKEITKTFHYYKGAPCTFTIADEKVSVKYIRKDIHEEALNKIEQLKDSFGEKENFNMLK